MPERITDDFLDIMHYAVIGVESEINRVQKRVKEAEPCCSGEGLGESHLQYLKGILERYMEFERDLYTLRRFGIRYNMKKTDIEPDRW